MIYKTCIFTPCRFIRLYNHFHHPVKFNCCFIKNIRNIIACFRNHNCTLAISKFISIFFCYCSFIHILESPYRNTTVNYIFTMVTGIVPTACSSNIRTLICSSSFFSRLIRFYPLCLNCSCISFMTAYMSQWRFITWCNIFFFNINTWTVLIIIVHSICQHIVTGFTINIITNLEWEAYIIAALEIILTCCCKIREIKSMYVVSGISIQTARNCFTCIYWLSSSIINKIKFQSRVAKLNWCRSVNFITLIIT